METSALFLFLWDVVCELRDDLVQSGIESFYYTPGGAGFERNATGVCFLKNYVGSIGSIESFLWLEQHKTHLKHCGGLGLVAEVTIKLGY